MSAIGISDIQGAACNSFMSLGYLATGAAVFLLTNGLAQAIFLGFKEQRSWTAFTLRGAAVAASIAMAYQMSTWADRDLIPITGEKMLLLFGLQAMIAATAGYLFKAPRFAAIFACASLNGYLGKSAVIAYGSAGAYLALEFLRSARRNNYQEGSWTAQAF